MFWSKKIIFLTVSAHSTEILGCNSIKGQHTKFLVRFNSHIYCPNLRPVGVVVRALAVKAEHREFESITGRIITHVARRTLGPTNPYSGYLASSAGEVKGGLCVIPYGCLCTVRLTYIHPKPCQRYRIGNFNCPNVYIGLFVLIFRVLPNLLQQFTTGYNSSNLLSTVVYSWQARRRPLL